MRSRIPVFPAFFREKELLLRMTDNFALGPSRAAEHDGRNAKLSVMRRKLSLMLG